MTQSQNLIVDDVNAAAERLENYDSHHDIDALDAEVTCNLEGDVREITLTLCTGGPHIEVDLASAMVRGYWGSDSHDCPVFENEEMLEEAYQFYKHQFEVGQ